MKGDKFFYPSTAEIKWTKESEPELVEACQIRHKNDCFPKDEIEEKNLLQYLTFLQGNRTSLPKTKKGGKKEGPHIKFNEDDKLFYFYRPQVVFSVLDWSCDSGVCDHLTRTCVEENKAETESKKPLEFYEYEVSLFLSKPIEFV